METDPRELVRKYGDFSLSYATLDKGVQRYHHPDVEGLVAYTVAGKTAIALSDPVCAPGDVEKLVEGYRGMAGAKGLRSVFFAATGRYGDVFKKAGYKASKVAEDSVLDIDDFTLKGNRMMNVRRGVNSATNAGLEISEYRPLDQRDEALERGCTQISEEWLSRKRAPRLEFILGELDWNDPGDRRFFIGSREGRLEGFLVFYPVAPNNWYLDMSRYGEGAPNGTTDALLVKAIETFRKKGASRLYLGMVPDVGFVGHNEVKGFFSKFIMGFLARHFERFYPVRSERFFKEKYRPVWEDLFMYTDAPLNLSLMRDVFKAFLPQGVVRTVLGK